MHLSQVSLAILLISISASANGLGFGAIGPLATPTKNLPDVMHFEDGTPVTTAAQWPKRRREMLATLIQCFTGTMPPPPGNLVSNEVDSQLLQNGRTIYKRFRLTFGLDRTLGMNVALFRPADALLRPIIIHPCFYPTPGDSISAISQSRAGVHPEYAAPSQAVELYNQALHDGYAILVFNYQQCAADNAHARSTGFLKAYPDCTWGGLAAWAWGMSRCVDFVETQAGLDHSRIILVGHSRLGKAALVAGALDERFALIAPAGSGCGGTGAFRLCGPGRGGKEGIESYSSHFPWQVTPHFLDFAADVYRLPFDQNWLIALVAPRYFIAADSYDDQYASSNALEQSVAAATPAFNLLNADTHLAVHFRHGPHALAAEDWEAILTFANRALGVPAVQSGHGAKP